MFLIIENFHLFIYSFLLYIFIFILPITFYIKCKEKVSVLTYLKLKNNPLKQCFNGFLISLLFIILLIIKNMALGWKPLNFNLGILWISGLMVGILEEIPFRGFVLQKLLPRISFWSANLLTTITFITIHIPIWTYSNANLLSSVKSALIFSLVLGYLFKEYDSLWVPITCHSIFNLSIWIGLS